MTTELQYKAKLAQLGTSVTTKSFQAKLNEAQEAAHKHATSQGSTNDENNVALRNGILRLINIASVVGVGFLALLMIVIIFGLFISEFLAVNHALEAFVSDFEAVVIAFVFVGAIFTFMFITKVRNVKRKDNYRFSFRLQLQNLAYILGIGENWEPQAIDLKQAELNFADAVNRLLLTTLIMTSAFGRLQPVLENTLGMNAVEGLTYLLTETSLTELVGILVITCVTLGILLSSEAIFAFIYSNFVRLAGALDLDPKEDYTELYEQHLSGWYETQIAQAHAKQQRKEQQAEAAQ